MSEPPSRYEATPAPPPVAGVRAVLRVPLTAVMFLTRLPCPPWVGHDAPTLSRSAVYFPADRKSVV